MLVMSSLLVAYVLGHRLTLQNVSLCYKYATEHMISNDLLKQVPTYARYHIHVLYIAYKYLER